jgi:hypothetical protein
MQGVGNTAPARGAGAAMQVCSATAAADDVAVKQSRSVKHCSTSQQWSVTGAGGGSVCSRHGTGGADVRFMPRTGQPNCQVSENRKFKP